MWVVGVGLGGTTDTAPVLVVGGDSDKEAVAEAWG